MDFSVFTAAISFFKNDIIKSTKGVTDNVIQYFDNGITPYLDSLQNKFKFTKTFLHRQAKIDFYSLYFPLDLKSKNKKKQKMSAQSINELFSISNYLTIIGAAGSGKSMLTKHLFLNSLEEKFKIPIIIELRRLNELEGKLIDYIEKIFIENEIARNKRIFKKLLKHGKFVFLFDGYDEIYSSNKVFINNEIEEFIDTYSLNFYLITTRPGTNIELFPRFTNIFVQDLSRDQIKKFVNQQVIIWGKDQEFSNRINEAIFSERNSDYVDYLKNPLLLSMYILSFENNSQIPKKKSTFYGNVFRTLCTRHDSISKQGWLHEKQTNLSTDEVETILEAFSFVTFFQGKYEFSRDLLQEVLNEVKSKIKQTYDCDKLIEDLEVAISIIIRDGGEFKFPHRSMQEYFAMKFVKNKPDHIKETIYGEKLAVVEKSSYDSHFNFWFLCLENDEYQFLKFFILPQLKMYLPFCKDKYEKSKVVIKLFEMADIQFGFSLDKSDKYKYKRWRAVVADWVTLFIFLDEEEKIKFSPPYRCEIYSYLLEELSPGNSNTKFEKDKNSNVYVPYKLILQNPDKFGVKIDDILSSHEELFDSLMKVVKKTERILENGKSSDSGFLEMI